MLNKIIMIAFFGIISSTPIIGSAAVSELANNANASSTIMSRAVIVNFQKQAYDIKGAEPRPIVSQHPKESEKSLPSSGWLLGLGLLGFLMLSGRTNV